MKTITVCTAVLALTIASTAFGMKNMILEGGRVGNGGGLVVCRDSVQKITSVELLDYYEAKTLRGFKLDSDSLSGDWKKQTQQLIQRLGRLSPLREKIYSEWLKRFEGETLFLKQVQFSKIPDSEHVAVPEGCEFEQGAIQSAPRFTGDKRYFINDKFWQNMTETERAGLVMHEFLYREAMGYGHTDSISVRYLNGYILNEAFKELKQQAWLITLQQAHYEMSDVPMPNIGAKAKLDLNQIWRPGPDETVPTIELTREWPIALGRCLNEDCSRYADFYEAKFYERLPDNQGYEIVGQYLHYWVSEFELPRYSVISHNTPNIKNYLRFQIQDGKLERIRASQFAGEIGRAGGFTLQYPSSPYDSMFLSYFSADLETGLINSATGVYFHIPQFSLIPTEQCSSYDIQFNPNGTLGKIEFSQNQEMRDPFLGKPCQPTANALLEINGEINYRILLKNTVRESVFLNNDGELIWGDVLSFNYKNGASVRCDTLACVRTTPNSNNGSAKIRKDGFELSSSAQINFRLGLEQTGSFSAKLGSQKIVLYPTGIPKSVNAETASIYHGANMTAEVENKTIYFDDVGGLVIWPDNKKTQL